MGNGDVKRGQDGKGMVDERGGDGVMMGRGGVGKGWMMYGRVDYLERGEVKEERKVGEKM
ncbi:tRNA-dihydrouridine synthase, partial [Bacillus pumilus]|uniref:tRNA-dihydrouridine synthase n=1 Tax=Bacillus pumilus TaxID=1408 RepID=UPI0021B69004